MNIKDIFREVKYPIELFDSNQNMVYREDSHGWVMREYDSNDNEIYCEYDTGFWFRKEIDRNGNTTYYEDSDGGWYKQEFDGNSNVTSFKIQQDINQELNLDKIN